MGRGAERKRNEQALSESQMVYVNYTIHLPDPKLLKRIKAAAKKLNVSTGAFIRLAAEKAVVKYEKKRAV